MGESLLNWYPNERSKVLTVSPELGVFQRWEIPSQFIFKS
jgi:hypothetical protein